MSKGHSRSGMVSLYQMRMKAAVNAKAGRFGGTQISGGKGDGTEENRTDL